MSIKTNYALISCFDKSGLERLLPALIARGFKLLATGGSFEHIEKLGHLVTEVSELTGKGEIFGGRVKTLQYEILGSILLRVGQDEKEWPHDFRIAAVVCNFYPFKDKAVDCKTMDELIEWVDIGGPTMVRASAKNYKHVYCFTSPRQYAWLDENNKFGGDEKLREQLALDAFDLIHDLDRRIAFELHARLRNELRYGENPHQKAVFLTDGFHESMGDVSFNNIRDAEAALKFVLPFTAPTVGVIKHGTLCGAASATDEKASNFDAVFEEAWEGDTVSRFGGILAFNRTPTQKIFDALAKRFIEVLVLPKNAGSKAWADKFFQLKPNTKIFLYDREALKSADLESFGNSFGTLIQKRDTSKFANESATEKFFAVWTAACSKSNAVTLVGTDAKKGLYFLAGAGQGQPNRVECLEKLALPRALDFCKRRGYEVSQLTCSSDAFFPFDDILHVLAKAGVKSVLQPGGSKNDATVVETAKKLQIEMSFTQERHFWH